MSSSQLTNSNLFRLGWNPQPPTFVQHLHFRVRFSVVSRLDHGTILRPGRCGGGLSAGDLGGEESPESNRGRTGERPVCWSLRTGRMWRGTVQEMTVPVNYCQFQQLLKDNLFFLGENWRLWLFHCVWNFASFDYVSLRSYSKQQSCPK